MLRTRDFLAAVALFWLTKSAYYKPANNAASASLTASLRLAFYLPRSTTNLFPEVFDVDGDGTPEALAVITNATSTTATEPSSSTTSWNIQILDLRQFKSTTSYQRSYPAAAPFQPKKLIETDRENAVTGQDAVIPNEEGRNDVIPLMPLVMTTGQVLKAKDDDSPQKHETKNKNVDRTDQYFCGTDWHDAANKCGTHCPSGQSSDCPENERCFADTPCSALEQQQQKENQQPIVDYETLHTTPAGGWPSIFTVFSQGIVTMHSLTAEHGEEPKQKQKLQVKRMWQVNPLLKDDSNNVEDTSGVNKIAAMEWEDVAVTFVDAVSSSSSNGILVVAGSATAYYHQDHEDDDDDERSTEFVIALDALTGRTIWQSLSQVLYKDKQDGTSLKNQELPLPFQASRGSTSAARRRSLIPQHVTAAVSKQNTANHMGVSTANCMREYRRSLLTSSTTTGGGALPFQFSGAEDDTVVKALHFDHQGGAAKPRQPGRSNGKPATALTNKATSRNRRRTKQQASSHRWWPGIFSSGSNKNHNKHHRHHNSLLLGRPNVIVTHNYQGLQVRALKNGQSLCHLSLEDQTLYHDINHDGTLDSLQIVTSSNSFIYPADDDEVLREQEWVQNLASRVQDLNKKKEELGGKNKDAKSQRLAAKSPLCHLLALSGIPTKEELFSVDLCGPYYHEQRQQQLLSNDEDIVGAPLLVVESSARGSRRSGYDVVAAVNTGTVSRFRGTFGRRIFQVNGRRQNPEFPIWDRPENVLLSRIDAPNVIPFLRPIVLAGENSVVLLSAMTGDVLASATFPQLASRHSRPRLVDLNGDGTTDLLVSTTDAVWGYQVVVRTGATVFYRIALGLLIMFMMLALLRNKFGPHPGKRSTDL